MKKQLLLLLFLITLYSGFSQNNYWSLTTDHSNMKTIKTKTDLPKKTLFNLNLTELNKTLLKTPSYKTSFLPSPIIITIPNSKGIFEDFSVKEASIMHPDLAAKYPEIKSYIGKGITDPTAVIRFSISPQGMHSMKLSGNTATEFIEPYSIDKQTYTIYTRSEKSTISEKISCKVEENIQQAALKSITKNANDAILRTYRLAISTTGEYTQFHGGTKLSAMAAINATMTRVNGIFENDFNVTMILIANNDTVVYTDPSTDPYTNSYNSQLQNTLTNVIGESNYDIGHVFVKGGNNGNAGCIGCVCVDGRKGSGFTSRNIPQGDAFDIDYVAHEIGHQFGANHTFSFRNESTNAHFEPGSGSTIMGYAGITGATDVQQNSDPYFHFHSIEQVTNYIKTTSCQTNTSTGNSVPVVSAGPNYTIPKGTPFVLTGQASDADGDTLTYCWEQKDENNAVTTYPSATATNGVSFRSFSPTTVNSRYFPRLETIKSGATFWQWEAIPEVSRTLNFRLTVRDNKPGGGANNSDDMAVIVTNAAGPFLVNAPNINVNWVVGSNQSITWDVAETNTSGINANQVDIFLSVDGGNTYPINLATNVTNDGNHTIIVPNNVGLHNRIMVKGSNHIFFDISDVDFQISNGDTSDTETPSIPENLVTTNITLSSADISWDSSSDNVGVIGYDIYKDSVYITTVTSTSYQATGLFENTNYSFAIKSKDAAGNTSDLSSETNFTTLPMDTNTGCQNGVISFPYTESFESSFNTWTQNETIDDFNWTLQSGNTPSNNTGPSNASLGDYYIYIESSNPNNPNKNAIITSPCIDLRNQTQAHFSFNYHMYGSNSMGSLSLEISNDNGQNWNSIWSKGGNQGNSWETAMVNLNAYLGMNILLRFNGITGTTWQGDMAIDAINLSTDVVNPNCTEVTLAITLDNYPEETSWGILNDINEVVASGGTYNNQPDGATISITECLPTGTYTLVVNDTFGDGICCQYGNGSYTLSTSSTILASGGAFGSSEATTFTIGNSLRETHIKEVITTDPLMVSIYPNPISENDILHVVLPKNDIDYYITDLIGRILKKGRLHTKEIDVNKLNTGIYILHLEINNKVISKRFIKK